MSFEPRPPHPAPKTPEQIAQEERLRQLRLSYGNVFGSQHGQIVLADLKARYGWDGDVERPSYRPGMDHAATAHADGMKEPVRHILAMTKERPQTKPTTATTA